MKEFFRRESRLVAVSLIFGLGGVACGSKSEVNESAKPKTTANNAVFLEDKAAEIEYLGNNYRQATIAPYGLVFEEFCQGSDMHLLRLNIKTLKPAGEMVVEDVRECQDGRITPEDFGERLTPANQELDLPY